MRVFQRGLIKEGRHTLNVVNSILRAWVLDQTEREKRERKPSTIVHLCFLTAMQCDQPPYTLTKWTILQIVRLNYHFLS